MAHAVSILDRAWKRTEPNEHPCIVLSDLPTHRDGKLDLAVLDALGLELAKRYHSEAWDYTSADWVANDLFKLVIENCRDEYPGILFEVYDAFDAGEFRRPSDPKDSNPADLYTKPDIADFLTQDWTTSIGLEIPDPEKYNGKV